MRKKPQKKMPRKSKITHKDLTTIDLIKLHYKKLGLDVGWGNMRFDRLCKLLNCLPEELGACVAMSGTSLKACRKADKFPPTVSLHFAMIEGFIIEMKSKSLKTQPCIPIHLIINSQK